jgi:UDPglucose--hexose-1-phosphate uridylyltransferase
MPEGWCPFCPGSGQVPEAYDVHVYPNDFPSFASPPAEPSLAGTDLLPIDLSWGACDVVLYHPDHNTVLREIEPEHLFKLAKLWQRRYLELFENKKIQYVYIFENHGEEIGVTMPHPHGQIYAFPIVPPVPAAEMKNAGEHLAKTGRCLHCDILENERRDGRRLLFDDGQWTAFLPSYARWPYELHLYPNRCVGHLGELTDDELRGLMRGMQRILKTYFRYYEKPYPYMKFFHQAPPRAGQGQGTHLHVEFNPIRRSPDKLKYRAGCETGAGLVINDSYPEVKAAELRRHFVNTQE